MRQGLIDEYRLCIAPVVLREGTPLCRGLQTGGVLLRYAPQA